MPYIKQSDRDIYVPSIIQLRRLLDCATENDMAGHLNFCMSTIIVDLCKHKESYDLYNSMIGALECIKLELYRRKVALYEDGKIQKNGDI